jgi:S-(hydroxymethyl)glutathione dehydrogenase / alcohol dehydrogenase
VSVRVGDRVIMNLQQRAASATTACACVRTTCNGPQDFANEPFAALPDGRGVFGRTGAMSEIAITYEDYLTPLFSDVSSAEISMLTCVGGCGLGMTMTNAPIEVASDVVIFGAGPVGLSAVQGARIKGASRIIVVEPIPYRRELALKLGGTDVVDPNQYKERTAMKPTGAFGGPGTTLYRDALVEHLREMTKPKTERRYAGGGRIGPDHILEAVGGDRIKPKSHPQGPDPTGVTVLQQLGARLGRRLDRHLQCRPSLRRRGPDPGNSST